MLPGSYAIATRDLSDSARFAPLPHRQKHRREGACGGGGAVVGSRFPPTSGRRHLASRCQDMRGGMKRWERREQESYDCSGD